MIRTLKVKKRLTRLYRKRPKGSRVICFDEFGPLELRPQYGMHWAQRRHPQRLPATYTRHHGVRHLLAFFDVHRDQFWGYFFQRKRWQETLRAFKRLRKRYPHRIRIYLILDNFSPHKRPEIRRWARENNVCLVWTPTNASWLNRIECQFTEIRKFSLDNTFHKSHRQLQRAVRRFIRYRNKRQRNKTKKKTQP